MDEQQKEVCRYLLGESYKWGFNLYPLEPIATKLGLTVKEIYDNDTNTGIMWKYGPHGNGVLSFHGTSAGVSIDTHMQLEHWSDYKGY